MPILGSMGAGSALSYGFGKKSEDSLSPMTWTSVNLGAGNTMQNVYWLNDRFVAFGLSGASFNVFHSTNGTSWSYASGAGQSYQRSCAAAYGAGNTILGGQGRITHTSSFSSYSNYTAFVQADMLLYFPNYSRFWMVQPGSSVYTSSTGSTRNGWTFLTNSSPTSMLYMYDGLVRTVGGTDTAILVGSDTSNSNANGRIAYSTNGGSTWTVNTVAATQWSCIWDGTKWVSVGYGYIAGSFQTRIHTSTDGTTWTDITGVNTGLESGFLQSIAYSTTRNRYVLGSSSSRNLTTFISDTNGASFRKIAYSPTLDRFVGVDGSTTIRYA